MRFIRDIINEKKRTGADGGVGNETLETGAPSSLPSQPVSPAIEPETPFGSGEFGPADQNLFTENEAETDRAIARAQLSSELRNAFLDEIETEPQPQGAQDDLTDVAVDVAMAIRPEPKPEPDTGPDTAPHTAASHQTAKSDPFSEPKADRFAAFQAEASVSDTAVEPDLPSRPRAPADPLVLQQQSVPLQPEPMVEPTAKPIVRPVDRQPSASQFADARGASAEISTSLGGTKAPVNNTPLSDAPVEVPAPAAGRGSRRAGRVKTRLLGFNSVQDGAGDPFTPSAVQTPTNEPANAAVAEAEPAAAPSRFPVGWLVIVAGPGRGTAFSLQAGVAQIGRGQGQAVRLDFGDNSISRENHAAVAYDPEQRRFFLGHGGKANLVRLNDRPVLSTEELQSGHLIRLGETTLRFIGLCGAEFDWDQERDSEPRHASAG